VQPGDPFRPVVAATGFQIASGAAWMISLKFAERSIGILSTLVLARLLTPADFGLVAMATAVVGFLELMGAFGFDMALIQRQDSRREHFDTAWTFNVIFGSACALLLVVLAIPAATFYHEPRLTWVLPVLAIGALAQGFENIGTVAFRKELRFSKEFRFLLSKKLAAFVVTIALALALRTYWALVGGIVTAKLLSVWISYRLHPYRPRMTLAAKRDLLHFSKWLFFSNLIQFLLMRSADFILGRTVGAHGLGIYSVAAEIAALPSTELVAPVNRSVYPAYSRLANDLPELRRRFLGVFGMIALAAFPASVGLAVVAAPAVEVLLGSQWAQAVPLLQLITVAGLAGALQSNLYLIVLALGRPKANTLLSASLLLAYLPAIVIASLAYGALGAAWAHLVMSLLALIPLEFIFLRVSGVRLSAHLARLWRPALAAAAMGAAVLAFRVGPYGMTHSPPLAQLIVDIGIGASTYLVSIVVLWLLAGRPRESAEWSAIDAARHIFRRFVRKAA
jgi:lipopolysaccharide exporter